jgi:hypothetical protein
MILTSSLMTASNLQNLTYTTPCPQAGQVRPSRQRISSKDRRQASSVPKRPRNSASLRPFTSCPSPSERAIRLSPQRPNPQKP